MDELFNAVSLGLVSVTQRGGGYLIRGAFDTLEISDALIMLRSEWMPNESAYYIPKPSDPATIKALEKTRKKSAVVYAMIAKRGTKAARDGFITFDKRRAAQERKATRELKEIYKLALMEHEAELKAVVEKYASVDNPAEAFELANRRGELKAIIEELSRGLSKAGERAYKAASGLLVESADLSRNIAHWQLENASGVRLSFRMLGHDFAAIANTAKTSYHGKYDLKAWQGVQDRNAARKAIKQAITRGVLTGEHPRKIAKRIKGLFTGNEPLSPFKRAVRITRTETHRVMTEAAQQTYKQAAAEGMDVKNRWVATLDSRTRKSHRKLDGKTVAPGEAFAPGIYKPGDGGAAESINCRCCLTPVHNGFTPKFRRDNETGAYVPYMSYAEWEKTRT